MSNENTNTKAAPYALNIMILDLETTGLDPLNRDVLEIGAVLADGTAFYARLKGYSFREKDAMAFKVNGLDPDDIQKGMDPKEAWHRFAQWAADWNPVKDTSYRWHIAGKNPSFDIGFLSEERYHYKFPFEYSRRGFDLHTVVAVVPLSDPAYIHPDHDAWYRLIGISEEPRPHHALRGALHEYIALRVLYNRPAPKSYLDAVNAIDYMALRNLEEPFIFNAQDDLHPPGGKH